MEELGGAGSMETADGVDGAGGPAGEPVQAHEVGNAEQSSPRSEQIHAHDAAASLPAVVADATDCDIVPAAPAIAVAAIVAGEGDPGCGEGQAPDAAEPLAKPVQAQPLSAQETLAEVFEVRIPGRLCCVWYLVLRWWLFPDSNHHQGWCVGANVQVGTLAVLRSDVEACLRTAAPYADLRLPRAGMHCTQLMKKVHTTPV